MIGSLLLIGFTLSLDNVRTSIVLGAIGLSWGRAVRVALVFGFWDGVAPLVGILGGKYIGQKIGSTADYVAAGALAAYGLYLVVQAWRNPEPEDPESEAREGAPEAPPPTGFAPAPGGFGPPPGQIR